MDMAVSIGNFESAIESAKNIFGGTKHHASDEEIKSLAGCMVILEQRGLTKLNHVINNICFLCSLGQKQAIRL